MKRENVYKILLAFIFVIGISLRLYHYLQNQSLWVDEASLAVNILNNSYLDLFEGLNFLQAAPCGFTVIIKVLVSLINPQTSGSMDLTLRFIPFLSGILALPAFYLLAKLVFQNNKKCILFSTMLLAFNPAAITYSVQLKQYSTELFTAIILLIIFYRINILNKFKFYQICLITIIPWFSYSSFFIIAAGFLVMLIKKRKYFVISIIFTLISFLLYYYISIKYVIAANYSGMDSYWRQCYAFLDFQHPTRLFFRIGELYSMSKGLTFCAGTIVLGAYFKYFFSSEHIDKKILFLLPPYLIAAASFFHLYPLSARLILFLLPCFILLTISIKNRYGFLLLNFGLYIIMTLSITNYRPDINPICYSYARELTQSIQKKIKPKDIILIESPSFSDNGLMYTEYDYYLKFLGLDNKVIKIPLMCRGYTIELCKKTLKELPAGEYYFLSTAELDPNELEITGFDFSDIEIPIIPNKRKALYFQKGGKQ